MTSFPRSAYGTVNPNAGRPPNGDARAWGGWQWPNCPPSSLLGTTSYVSASTGGQTIRTTVRSEIVPLWNLLFEIADRLHGYPTWSQRNGENWGPWGLACRAVAGSNTPSGHSMALAVDINAPNNPMSTTWRSDMPPPMVAQFESCGMFWGGRFTGTFDPMHYAYCFPPASVAGHIQRARDILGTPPIPPVPDPEEITVPLILRRSPAGVDVAWAEDLSLFLRIPTEEYYRLLQAACVISVDHGAAEPANDDLIDWMRGQVAGSGGRVYEPAQ